MYLCCAQSVSTNLSHKEATPTHALVLVTHRRAIVALVEAARRAIRAAWSRSLWAAIRKSAALHLDSARIRYLVEVEVPPCLRLHVT